MSWPLVISSSCLCRKGGNLAQWFQQGAGCNGRRRAAAHVGVPRYRGADGKGVVQGPMVEQNHGGVPRWSPVGGTFSTGNLSRKKLKQWSVSWRRPIQMDTYWKLKYMGKNHGVFHIFLEQFTPRDPIQHAVSSQQREGYQWASRRGYSLVGENERLIGKLGF